MAKKVSVKDKINKAKIDLVADQTQEAEQNVNKLQADMEFAKKNLKDKIQEARTVDELESTQDYFEEIFGVNAEIPADLQKLYDAKLEYIMKGITPLEPIPPGWIPMTREEAKKHEQEGRLCGYSAERGIGLIK